MKPCESLEGRINFIKNAPKTQQAVETHCEPVVNNKAYSRDPTTSPCTELRFRVYTPTNRKTGEPVASGASGPAVFTEQGHRVLVRKVTVTLEPWLAIHMLKHR